MKFWFVPALLAAPMLALACGACVEDKVAATYDHAVVQAAAAQKKQMVFCEVQGLVTPSRMRAAAARVPGIDVSSVRVSTDPGAMSFALDPKVSTADAAALKVASHVGGGVKIVVLKVPAPARPAG